jgi:LmbE family N-acetylglucosaminyl deacetylase
LRVPRAVVRTIARTKPLVPEGAWPLLHALRSAVGEKPLVAPPSYRRALVLAPHPDDEAVGCGGTLAVLTEQGAEVTVAFASDGDATRGAGIPADEVARRRRGEAEESCAVLGCARPRFLGQPDGAVDGPAVARALTGLCAELRPEALFLPWFLDGHHDHEAVNLAVAEAELDASIDVWGFETWTPVAANRIVDVSATIDRKKAAIAAHTTAHLAFDVGAVVGLNRYRSVHGLMGEGYAEAFLVAPVPKYVELMRRARA